MNYKQKLSFFIVFLHKNKIYYKFINNLINYRHSLSHISYYLSSTKDTPFLISTAFEWQNTNEGDKFWSDISIKWYSLVDKYF